MTATSLTQTLKGEARLLGFDLVGACPAVSPPGIERFRQWLRAGHAGRMRYLTDRAGAYEHPRHVLNGVRSILMLGLNYRSHEPVDPAAGQAKVSRYAWGPADYHDVIHARLNQLARFHLGLTPQAGVRGVVDTAPLLEREFAQLAGLGWIGKNTLLLNTQFGSWFFLAALLTSEALEYDEPFSSSHCGTCRACLDACPTGALVDAYQLDARKCISYLTIELRDGLVSEHRLGTGNWLFGCDDCQDVCPWNRSTPRSKEKTFDPPAGMNPLDAIELLGLGEDAFRQRFRDTALWRPKRAGLLRSAALVLAARPHAAALPALIGGLDDRQAAVRAGCAWALGKYPAAAARQALEARLAIEPDPAVGDEIRRALMRPGSSRADPP